MSQRVFDRVLGLGRIVVAALKGDTKAILANVAEFEDDDDQPAGGANEQPMFGAAGVYCRPMAPDDRGSCEVVFMREADGATPIAARDLRTTRLVGPAEGAVGISHYAGGFVELSFDSQKRATMLIMRASRCDAQLNAVEKAHAFLLDPSEATSSIQLIHESGSAIVLDKDGRVTITDKNAANMVDVGPDGIVLSSNAGGIKALGGMVVGNPELAKKVVLLDETAAAFNLVAQALSLLSTQIMAPPQVGAGAAAQVAQLVAKIAEINTTGSSTTLKASAL